MEQTMIPIDQLGIVFSDLVPIPQDDGPEPVCRIQYPTSFILAYDYMRAVWKCQEFSERTLKLSATCLKLNPANYTVWHYRRQCLKEIIIRKQKQEEEQQEEASSNDYDDNNNDPLSTSSSSSLLQLQIQQYLQTDLNLAATLGGDNPKNYQIWYHRRALMEEYVFKNIINNNNTTTTTTLSTQQEENIASELNYISEVLEEDSKNYHAWSYRQWIIQTANQKELWDQEIEFARKLIQQDPRNNSAWNQRWFAVHQGQKVNIPTLTTTTNLDAIRIECDLAIFCAKLDPYNESPWRYLLGICKEQCRRYYHHSPSKEDSDNHGALLSLLQDYYTQTCNVQSVLMNAQRNPPEACANLTSARVDLLELMNTTSSLEEAIPLIEGLANEYDPIRKKYWMLRLNTMKQKLEKLHSN